MAQQGGPEGWALHLQAPTWGGGHQSGSGPHLFATAPVDFEIVSRARWDFVERSSFHQPSLTHPMFSPQKTPQQAPGDGGGAQSLASAAVTALQTCHLAGEPKATCVSFHVADFCFSYSLPRPAPPLSPSCAAPPFRLRRCVLQAAPPQPACRPRSVCPRLWEQP